MYNRWEQDIALMKSLGIKNYRCAGTGGGEAEGVQKWAEFVATAAAVFTLWLQKGHSGKY
jgi:hypothetical protein